jgi:hypothetical protein
MVYVEASIPILVFSLRMANLRLNKLNDLRNKFLFQLLEQVNKIKVSLKRVTLLWEFHLNNISNHQTFFANKSNKI